MPRNLSSGMLTAFQSQLVNPVLFVSLTFSATTIYLWTGLGTISWSGQSWLGLGSLLSLSPISEGSMVEAKGITVTVSGLDATILSECLTDFKVGLPVSVYLGAYTTPGLVSSLISTPILAWNGYTDAPSIEVSGQAATISLNCENKLVSMNVPTNRRYTHEDQQTQWPGDLGLMFVPSLQETTIFWGQTATVTQNV